MYKSRGVLNERRREGLEVVLLYELRNKAFLHIIDPVLRPKTWQLTSIPPFHSKQDTMESNGRLQRRKTSNKTRLEQEIIRYPSKKKKKKKLTLIIYVRVTSLFSGHS